MVRNAAFIVSFALIATVFSFKSDALIGNGYAEDAKYIGKEGCRECHTKLFKSYEATKRKGVDRPRRLPHSTNMLAEMS
ncbi:MAG: hypothetical protein HQK84_08125, partial [Nitrospinae bacterium]|nr:hypothetical protein [Nitrospinota bacterium]